MLEILVRASIEGAVLVALVWTVGLVARQLSPAIRTVLWWCAAAKFVLGLSGIAPIPVRILPPVDRPGELVTLTAPQHANETSSSRQHGTPAASPLSQLAQGPSVLVALWVVGCLAALTIGVRRWRQTIDVTRQSIAAPPEVEAVGAELASRLGLRSVPRIRLSSDVDTPCVAGLVHPAVLLPADRFASLSENQQRMTLCHELAHVKRKDLLLGCVPAIAEGAFFFHPLAHLAAREYGLWREAACDAAVLAALDAPSRDYGRLLLDLGVSGRRPGPAAAGASWSFTNLKRRIVMLDRQPSRSPASRIAAAAAIGLALLAVMPLRLAARPAPAETQSAAAPSPFDSLTNTTLNPRMAAVDDFSRAARAALEGLVPQKDSGVNYVMLIDDNHTTMSGSEGDVQRARRHKRPGERLLWFRNGGREYIVRDPAVLDQVEALWKPASAIGEAQGVVGSKQGAIGAQQGAIGAQQGVIGAQQGNIGARQGQVGARQSQLAARRERRSPSDMESKALDASSQLLDNEMRALDAEMRALDAKMRELDKPMRDLDEQMRTLDAEMRVLDGEMREAVRKAEAEMRELFTRTIASGVAEVVK